MRCILSINSPLQNYLSLLQTSLLGLPKTEAVALLDLEAVAPSLVDVAIMVVAATPLVEDVAIFSLTIPLVTLVLSASFATS